MHKILQLVTVLIIGGCTSRDATKSESFKPGFITIHLVDSARKYKPGAGSADYLYFRPVDLDLWYPATINEKDTAIAFRQVLGLLDQRANYYTASTAGVGLSQQIAKLFCDGFNCSDSSQLLNFRTETFNNAKPASGKFPLIIYLAAYNGMSYENFTLFETLARKGYVVVSISSIGRYPGDMTTKTGDLMEQVNDAILALKQLESNPGIDFTKIGLVGYSWGGLAAAVLAGKIPNIGCIVSLDGSEFHHYGTEKEEDADFDTLRNDAPFKTLQLNIPYLRLESTPAPSTDHEDSVYNFREKLSGQTQIFTIAGARHEDFGCLSKVVRQAGNCVGTDYYQTIATVTTAFLDEQLKHSHEFSQLMELENNKTIIKK